MITNDGVAMISTYITRNIFILTLLLMGLAAPLHAEVRKITGIVVDAKDTAAKQYYELFGFVPFTSEPLRLFLPIKTARSLANLG